MTRVAVAGSIVRSRFFGKLAAVAGVWALVTVSTIGCQRRSYGDVERVAKWSPAAMAAVGDIEPQIARQFNQATSKIKQSLEDRVAEQQLGEAVGELAMLHHVYGNQPEALEAYRVARALDREAACWSYYEAVLQDDQGDPEAAAVAFRLSLEKDPNYAPARVRLGELYIRQGELEAAAATYEAMSPATAASARGLACLAELAMERSGPTRAIALFREAQRLRPQNQRIRLGLGRALQRSGLGEEARELLAGGSASSPQDFELDLHDPLLADLHRLNISSQQLWAKAQALLRSGRPDEAEVLVRRALEAVPESSPFRTDLAAILAAKGDLDGAGREILRVLEADPGYLPALVQKARVEARQGKRREAIATYDRLLAIEDTHAVVYVDRGNLYRVLGEYQEAMGSYRRALELDPQNPTAYVWLSWLQYLEGRPQAALKTLRRGLERIPDSEWLKSLELRLRSIGLTAPEATGDLAAAHNLLRDNPTAFNAETLAMLFARSKDQGSALRWQRAALEAARQLEKPTELIESRLSEYEVGRGPSRVLDIADLDTARIALRRVDLEDQARSF